MLLSDELDLLRGIPLFKTMEQTKLKLMAFASDEVLFNAGETLFGEGQIADAAYVILKGEVEVIRNGAKVGTCGPQNIVGETAILTDDPRDKTVRALTEVETLRITKDGFQKLLSNCPGTLAKILRILGDRVAEPVA